MAPITFVTPGLGRSGGYRTICEWANRLAAQGEQVTIASPLDGPGRAYLDSDVVVRIPRIATSGLTRAQGYLRRFGAGLATESVVLPRLVRPLIPKAGRVIACFVPWIRELRADDRFTGYCQHWEPVFMRGSRVAERRAERAMSWPGPKIVNSTWLRMHFDSDSRLALAFPGVDLDVFRFTSAQPNRGRPRLVSLGRSDLDWKGLSDLLDAMPLIGLEVELVLYGGARKPPQQTAWGTQRAIGSISQQELAELVGTADVVVCPSWFESFPLPPLEAMAVGVPVVTTQPGTEDYAVDGVNAVVVPPQSRESLARAIRTVLSDRPLARSLVAAGRETASRFTWDAGFETFRRALEETAP